MYQWLYLYTRCTSYCTNIPYVTVVLIYQPVCCTDIPDVPVGCTSYTYILVVPIYQLYLYTGCTDIPDVSFALLIYQMLMLICSICQLSMFTSDMLHKHRCCRICKFQDLMLEKSSIATAAFIVSVPNLSVQYCVFSCN